MSGIEVVALVAAIISAFTGTASLLQERQKRKKNKARQETNNLVRLRRAVNEAPLLIQQEYDYDFARAGLAFAAGDEITREQLTRVLINLQQNMINRLQNVLLHPASSTRPHLSPLVDISHQSRYDSIVALSQQYQRFQVAAPIPRAWMDLKSMPATYSSPTACSLPSGTTGYPYLPRSIRRTSDPTESPCTIPSALGDYNNTATINVPQVLERPPPPLGKSSEAKVYPAPPPPPPPPLPSSHRRLPHAGKRLKSTQANEKGPLRKSFLGLYLPIWHLAKRMLVGT